MRHWESPRNREPELPDPGPAVPGPDGVLVGVALRLRRQVDHQSRLVERSAPMIPSGELAELRRGLNRMGRAGRHLLVLAGAATGGPPRAISALLTEAAGPGPRVRAHPAPLGTVRAAAADDLLMLAAELVDHVLDAAPPTAAVSLRGRWTDGGGLTVEVAGVSGAERDGDPFADRDEAEVLALAAQMGRRSGLGVTVPAPRTYIVHCPPVHLTAGVEPAAPPDTTRVPDPGLTSQDADELFGPLQRSVLEASTDDPEATPIFAAVASAWFRDDDGPRSDWNSAQDPEWAAAAARADADDAAAAEVTTAGLPRRRPGTQMVTPPRRSADLPTPTHQIGHQPSPSQPDPARAGPTQPGPTQPDREPERVRSRLAVYQQGLRQGRHRAAEEPGANGHRAQADDLWRSGS